MVSVPARQAWSEQWVNRSQWNSGLAPLVCFMLASRVFGLCWEENLCAALGFKSRSVIGFLLWGFLGTMTAWLQQPDGSYFAKCLEAGQLRYSLFPVYLLTFLHRTFCFFQGCHVVSSCVNKAFQGMFSALKFRLPRKKEGEFWRSSLLSTGVHPIDPFSCMFCWAAPLG